MYKIDIETIKSIHTVDVAVTYLFSVIPHTDLLQHALDFSIESHKTQFRKSGEPYVVHPILVASIVASITENSSMVIAALLHDVVEDTEVTIEKIKVNYGDRKSVV